MIPIPQPSLLPQLSVDFILGPCCLFVCLFMTRRALFPFWCMGTKCAFSQARHYHTQPTVASLIKMSSTFFFWVFSSHPHTLFLLTPTPTTSTLFFDRYKNMISFMQNVRPHLQAIRPHFQAIRPIHSRSKVFSHLKGSDIQPYDVFFFLSSWMHAVCFCFSITSVHFSILTYLVTTIFFHWLNKN